MADALTPLQIARLRQSELINARSAFIAHWMTLRDYVQPRLGRFHTSDDGRTPPDFATIYDNAATIALRTLGAGMMSGMTSPARPWFRLGLSDKDLMEFGPVKAWLHQTTLLIRDIFAKSNTYRVLQQGYEELGLFGTWATFMLQDYDTVLHHFPMTAGQYALSTNFKGQVDTVVREISMTVGAMVSQFGYKACSPSARNLYDRHQLNATVQVVHLVEPNSARDPSKRDNRNMRWKSCYWEASADNSAGFLRESGFKRFPVLAPRWFVRGDQDVYGAGPGSDAIGDAKQLQHEQLRKGQGIDYQVHPPLQVPTSYKDAARNRLPGGVMYVDAVGSQNAVRSAWDVQLQLGELREDIMDVRDRIRSAFYADLFLMLANDTRSNVTATEVAERHEEKLLMLGPTLERLHNELLSPKIDTAFDFCAEAGILPPPPPEMRGVDLNIEFISVLAQAQRMVSASGVDRLLGTIGSVSNIYPEARDKVNIDQVIDDYGDMFGVNPEIIVPDDVVAQRRAERAKAQAAQQTGMAASDLAKAAKTLGETDGVNMRDVMNQFQGYNSPAPQEV